MPTISDFEKTSFVVKDWINDACRKRPSTQSLEKYINQLELQLQLKFEEVESDIEQTTNKLAQRIPAVIQGAEIIKKDMMGLHQVLETVVERVHERSLTAKDTVKGIDELHGIKANMQSACSSLKEATELSELFVRVDAVFSSGDLFAMSKIMTTMHRSFKLVGNVPEFQSGKQKLALLEQNLVTFVEAKLAIAISTKQNDQAQKLSEILSSLDRLDSLEKLYVESKKQEMRGVIQGTAERLSTDLERDVLEAVKEWYESLSMLVHNEIEWCSVVFPTHTPRLLSALLPSLLTEWNTPLGAVLKRHASVPLTIAVQRETVDVYLSLKPLVEAVVEEKQMALIVTALFAQTEIEVARLAEIQRGNMTRCFDQKTLDLTSVEQIDASMAALFTAIDQALDDVIDLTGGTEVESCTKQIEFCLHQFISVVSTTSLKAIRRHILPQSPAEEADIPTALHLLKTGYLLEKNLDRCRSKIIETIDQIQTRLDRASEPADLVHMRLRSSPAKKDALSEFLSKDDWMAYEEIKQAIRGFSAASEALVFDVFMHKPRSLFHAFGQLEEWTREEPTSSLSSSLPQFHSYPLHYVSNLGEYLMLVPQQLEALVSTETETDDLVLDQQEEKASALLNKVIVGSAEIYSDEILALKKISESGETQLKSDLQYFSNVLSAMGSPFPTPLVSIYEALESPLEQLRSLLDTLSPGNSRRVVAQTVYHLRGGTR